MAAAPEDQEAEDLEELVDRLAQEEDKQAITQETESVVAAPQAMSELVALEEQLKLEAQNQAQLVETKVQPQRQVASLKARQMAAVAVAAAKGKANKKK